MNDILNNLLKKEVKKKKKFFLNFKFFFISNQNLPYAQKLILNNFQ